MPASAPGDPFSVCVYNSMYSPPVLRVNCPSKILIFPTWLGFSRELGPAFRIRVAIQVHILPSDYVAYSRVYHAPFQCNPFPAVVSNGTPRKIYGAVCLSFFVTTFAITRTQQPIAATQSRQGSSWIHSVTHDTHSTVHGLLSVSKPRATPTEGGNRGGRGYGDNIIFKEEML